MKEIDQRRIWAERGFSNLMKYCVEIFGMSESDVYRKISIMRTIQDLPEVETKILEGKLNPTTVAQANTFFRKEAKLQNRKIPLEQKKEVLKRLEGKSQRAAEIELALLSPEACVPEDKIRVIAENKVVNQFTSDRALIEKLDRLKGLLLHSLPKDPSQAELLHKICDIALAKIDPSLKPSNKVQPKSPTLKNSCVKEAKDCKSSNTKLNPVRVQHVASDQGRRSYIPVNVRRLVWQRDSGRCTYQDPLTNRRCDSTLGLEYDHKVPFAKGGTHSFENLRLACRAHNTLYAIQHFGQKKISSHMPSLQRHESQPDLSQ